ncbi:hypothetical protein GCM10023334_074540 [Nonomuraea thailandensis]
MPETGGTRERASGWERVAEAVYAGDASRAADEVLRLDAAGRREVARRLPGRIGPARDAAHARFDRLQAEAATELERARQQFVEAATAGGLSEEEAHHRWWTTDTVNGDDDLDWLMRDSWIAPMRVAGAGTLGGAAAVATWIFRRDFAGWNEDLPVTPLLRVITARPAEWQADLAVRVARRLRGIRRQQNDGTVELALELLRRTGVTPPDHDPLVVAWVSTTPDLAADPLARHLVPRLFEAEGVGRALRDERLDRDPGGRGRRSWLHALRDLADAGLVEREALIDGCVRRFLRGGSAADLRFFVRLHDLLAPGHSPERVRDYLRLLPSAPGPVAELALRQLHPRADAAPSRHKAGGAGAGMSGEEVGEAVAALLFRAESKLVRAGLTLLDQATREAEGELDPLAPALASAFLCESYEVRERSVRLAVKYAGRFTPAGAEAVREAAGVLPPELAARLAEPFGAAPAPVFGPECDDFEAVPLPSFEAPARDPFPAAITNLAETFDQLHHEFSFERWLDGFVRDPEARKHPVRTTNLYVLDEWSSVSHWTEALLRESTEPGRSGPEHEAGPRHGMPAGPQEGMPTMRTPEQQLPGWRLPDQGRVAPPHWAMLLRCAELLGAVRWGTLPPYLLATPTSASCHVDPAELVARIEGYERAGVRHLPADLEQALLRLPREVDPEVTARAGRLARTSEAGAALESWLRRRPEPVTRVEWPQAVTRSSGLEPQAEARSGRPVSLPRGRVLLEPTGMPLVDALMSDPPPRSALGAAPGCNLDLWRLMLPSDREVAAVQLLSQVFDYWRSPGHLHTYVTRLCHQDGPVGEGTALVLGALLAERGWHADHCHELLLRAIATGYLPAGECGRQLGRCLRGTGMGLSRVTSALEDAARGGAHRAVWEIMRGLLPVFLPAGEERAHSGHTRALEFAADAARWAGARGTIPEVAAIAARKGSSGLVRAARRLHEHLDRA